MFGSSAHQASGDPDLDAAHEELESLRSWALVHGLATMIKEGTIAPAFMARVLRENSLALYLIRRISKRRAAHGSLVKKIGNEVRVTG